MMLSRSHRQQGGGPADYPGAKPSQLLQRVEALRQELALRDPRELAMRSGARYLEIEAGFGKLVLPFWSGEVSLEFPALVGMDSSGKELNPVNQALLVYYLYTTNGVPVFGRWISFADLPDGRFYSQAFQGYTGAELVRCFGEDVSGFEKAARAAGGFGLSLGDSSFSFRLFPRVALAVIYWLGDDDLPSSCQVLFDEAAALHLPTDACAIAGSMLARRIMAARNI